MLVAFYIQERNRLGDLENPSDRKEVVQAEEALLKWIAAKPRYQAHVYSRNAPIAFRRLGTEGQERLIRSLLSTGKLVQEGKTFLIESEK